MLEPLLLEFERRAGLTTVQASAALGVAYSSYMGYRPMSRPLPPYVRRHVEHLLALPHSLLHRLTEPYRV